MFELVDAVLCADGAVKSPVDWTLLPEHRREHGAMYGGLNHGRIDVGRLRAVPAGLPLPRFDGGRPVGADARCRRPADQARPGVPLHETRALARARDHHGHRHYQLRQG
ncbi:transposase [Streptomyces nodosus]